MSNLSELLPAGSGAKVAEFVASGTLASGQTVALKSNGQVEAVTGTTVSAVDNAGTPVVFEAASINYTSTAYDATNDKIVIFYSDSDNSGYGTAVVSTVSGTTISFGTPVVFQTSLARHISATYDSNSQKIIIAYSDNSTSDRGTAIVGTVSGTSISFGTAVVYNSGFTYYNSAIFDSTNNKVVIAYEDYANNNYGTAIVGTVSGTSISFGSEVVFESANTIYTTATFDSNANKVVIAYRDGGNSNYGTAIVGTVSGTSISFGSEVVFESAITNYISTTFDSDANKVVIAYTDQGNSNYGTAVLGTVTGTSINFGTAVVFEAAYANYSSVTYDKHAKKVVIAYSDVGSDFSGHGTAIVGTVSGTSISFGTAIVFESSDSNYISSVYDANAQKVVISYRNGGNSGYGTSSVWTTGFSRLETNYTDFLGITNEAISNSATGEVAVQGGVITSSNLSVALATGAEVNLSGKTQSEYPSIAYDTANNKYVVLFADGNNGEYGTAVVVTVSGTTVSFGTPVVFNSGRVNHNDIVYNATAGQFMIVYQDRGTSNQAQAIIGTVSGTSISFGTEQVYSTASVTGVAVAYNTTLNKYLAGSSASGAMSVAVLSVSGTTISVGTPVALSGTKYKPNIKSNESASSFVITNNKNDNQSEAHLITVSGTTPTVETSADISSAVSTSYPRTGLTFLENNKFVCVYSESNTNNMYTRTITVSGSSLSLGTASSAFTVDADGQTSINSRWPLFFVSTTEAYLYYQDDTSNFLKYVPIAISSTTATSGTEISYTSETSAYPGFLYSSTVKQSLSFFQSTNAGQQTAAIAQNGNLVLGTDYFVQTDGSLSTTTSTVPAGRALSTTSILLEG